MTIVALAVFSFDAIHSQERADIVYEERGDEIAVAIERAESLSGEDTTVQIDGDDCGTWEELGGGSGTIEQGDIVIVDNCSFEEGDTVQVIGSRTLVDTYEVLGIDASVTDSGGGEGPGGGGGTFTDCEDIGYDRDNKSTGDDVDIDADGGVHECDVTLPSNVDYLGEFEFEFEEGAVLDGVVFIESDDKVELEIEEGSTIEGPVDIESDDEVELEIEDPSTIEGPVDIESDGEVELELDDGGTIEGDVEVESGDEVELEVEDGSTIDGDIRIWADDDVEIEEDGGEIEGGIYINGDEQ